jgi:putative phage-type endonuclease
MIHNETMSIDGLIDRLLAYKKTNKFIIDTLSVLFPFKTFTADTIKLRKATQNKYKVKLEQLKLIKRIEQRSPEWYATRNNLVTASDFAQALGEGKFGTQKQFYQKKSGYEKESFDANCPPLKWGCMYEQVAQTIYAQRNNTTVVEFGLIKHPNYDFFGASPDGITTEGIMVEIKCPYKRKITGEVPLQYYYQIQGQLDVCDLQECDYFECKFESCNVSPFHSDFGYERGAIVETIVNNESTYIYSDVKLDWNEDELVAWAQTQMNDSKEENKYVVHYYVLDYCNTVRVHKSDDFITEKMEELRVVWDNVLRYRQDRSQYEAECKSTTRAKKVVTATYSKSLNLDLPSDCLFND